MAEDFSTSLSEFDWCNRKKINEDTEELSKATSKLDIINSANRIYSFRFMEHLPN